MALATTPEGGVGITLSNKAVGGSTYTPIGQLRDDCEFSGFETTVIPLPVLSTVVLAKTPGRIDYGSFTGSVYLVLGDASVIALAGLSASRALMVWQVQLTDDLTTPANSSTATFTGFVSSIKPGNFTGEDAPTMDFEIAISGAVTLAAGT